MKFGFVLWIWKEKLWIRLMISVNFSSKVQLNAFSKRLKGLADKKQCMPKQILYQKLNKRQQKSESVKHV